MKMGRTTELAIWTDEVEERASEKYDPYDYIGELDDEHNPKHKLLDFVWNESE